MINAYYQQQLALLRELGTEFGRKYPALAPMLAGQSADPDVERLIEGTAFLSGLVQERLDDDFPELVHSLTELMFPHYLHPIPSSTVIRFSYDADLSVAQLVPARTELGSVPVEGTSCIYTTIDDVTVYPLDITSQEDRGSEIELNLRFSSGSLNFFNIDRLRFFVSGEYGDASDVIFDLTTHLQYIEIADEENRIVLDPKKSLELLVKNKLSVVPCKKHMFQAFRSVQEYFQLPELFCFFNLVDLKKLGSSSDTFRIRFVFDNLRAEKSRQRSDCNLELYCVPAVNVFDYEAETISLDYHQSDYKVNPYNGLGHYQVYSVNRVTGFIQGSVNQREYLPFEKFNPQSRPEPVYSIRRRRSKISDSNDVYISVAIPSEKNDYRQETLVLSISCTNGKLTDALRLGDICVPNDKIPLFIKYTNITHPTSSAEAPIGRNLLWRLLSHIYLNQNSMASAEALTSLLKLYIFVDSENKAQVQMNTRKVECIEKVEEKDITRLISGIVARGKLINISFNRDGFASAGDMYIFANVIQQMLGAYTGINNFTIVNFCDLSTGKVFTCQQLQMGSRVIL
ncbi:MAG: type VI secretion system baseplate subunit TssF [Succinivibrionaceae bacterium]